jgi:Flp pilus assembly protein TadG
MYPMYSRFRRVSQDESGQMLIWFAILLPVVFGFVAIAIDVGIGRYQKIQLQSAADAAALASTLEVSYCGGTSACTLMRQAATQSLVENGYSNVSLAVNQCSSSSTTSSTGITVTLNNGPCILGSSDPNYGNLNTVEILVTKQEPSYIGRILGFDHITIAARAEASLGSSPYCIYNSVVPVGTPSPDNYGAVTVNSGGHITASCGMMNGSSNGTAFLVNNGAHVDTTANTIHGGDLLNGGGNSVHVSPPPVTNALALPDPLSFVTPPTNIYGSCQSLTGNIPSTLSAGCYSGLTVKGKLQLNPGLYYITGPVLINSGSSVTGTDVTFFVTGNGSLTMNSGSNLNISAPVGTSGQTGTANSANALYNIVYYQASTDTNTIIYDGGSKSALQGIFYAPGAQIDINSGGNTAKYTILDTKSLMVNSGAKLNLGSDYSSQPDGQSPIKGVTAILSE